jgi:hypothetical protein
MGPIPGGQLTDASAQMASSLLPTCPRLLVHLEAVHCIFCRSSPQTAHHQPSQSHRALRTLQARLQRNDQHGTPEGRVSILSQVSFEISLPLLKVALTQRGPGPSPSPGPHRGWHLECDLTAIRERERCEHWGDEAYLMSDSRMNR